MTKNNLLELLQSGAENWNAKMEKEPFIPDFSNQTITVKNIAGFRFPQGVLFHGSRFPDGVDFSDSFFGGHLVGFSNTHFSGTGPDFTGAVFEAENVSFANSSFNSSDGIKFEHCTFDVQKTLNFKECSFHGDFVAFTYSSFMGEFILFNGSKFNSKRVSFVSTTIDCTELLLSKLELADRGIMEWANSIVRCEDLMFENGQFENSNLIFNPSILKVSYFSCRNSLFQNLLIKPVDMEHKESVVKFCLEDMCISEKLDISDSRFTDINKFSLVGSKILSVLNMSGSSFCNVPDLRQTYVSNHLSVGDIFLYDGGRVKNPDHDEIEVLRRLREVAKKSEDRKTELDILSFEFDTQLQLSEIPKMRRFLIFMYKLMSNYGRSILAPIMSLLFLIAISSVVFFLNVSDSHQILLGLNEDPTCTERLIKLANWSLTLSVSNSIPFAGWSSGIRPIMVNQLYGGVLNAPIMVQVMAYFQSIGSVVLLFLIGLGFRNNFKL